MNWNLMQLNKRRSNRIKNETKQKNNEKLPAILKHHLSEYKNVQHP